MNDDATLLRHYAESGSDTAFTDLVHRHVDLVYRAALRRTSGDTHHAADIAQQVFTTLAREARQLSHHTALSAWLHTATRNAALNLVIADQRRRARELAAQSLAPATDYPGEILHWERLRPVLDSAIDDLSESDRTAVILRFLEQRPFAEVGAALRVSEDAARVRTTRALDKLRDALARRGITSTASAVGALVSSQPLVSAPAGLAAAFAARSLATAAASFAAAGTTAFMSLKLVTTATLTAVAAFGAGAYFGFSRDFDAPPPPPLETPRHSELIASLRKDNLSLRAQVDQLNASVATLRAAPRPAVKPTPVSSAATPSSDELVRSSRQKAILNNLRQLAAATDQFQLENKRPPSSLEELVGETKYIRRLNPVHGENYSFNPLVAGGALTVTDSDGNVVTYDPRAPKPPQAPKTPEQIRADELNQRLRPSIAKAVDAYRAANNGTAPTAPESIVAYFATPQEGADFVELIEAQKAAGRK